MLSYTMHAYYFVSFVITLQLILCVPRFQMFETGFIQMGPRHKSLCKTLAVVALKLRVHDVNSLLLLISKTFTYD